MVKALSVVVRTEKTQSAIQVASRTGGPARSDQITRAMLAVTRVQDNTSAVPNTTPTAAGWNCFRIVALRLSLQRADASVVLRALVEVSQQEHHRAAFHCRAARHHRGEILRERADR